MWEKTMKLGKCVGAGLTLLVLAMTGRADEAGVIKAVEALGGKVTVDDKQPGKPVVGVNLDESKVTDNDLKQLKEFKKLQTLSLDSTKITDAGLKELKEITSLQALSLNGTKVTDNGLKELKELKNLKSLAVAGTAVTDAGVKELKAALSKLDVSQ
jgi:internalin A